MQKQRAIGIVFAGIAFATALMAQRRPAPAAPAVNPLIDSGPFTPPAGVDVKLANLAPVEQGNGFAISPHGEHVAVAGHNGSRAVINYDGVEGPKFDQLFVQGQAGPSPVVFSPEGSRWAYCGKQGGNFVVMVDGKELVRSAEKDHMGFQNVNSCMLGFTANGKHVYFTSFVKIDASHSAVRFVWDGKGSPLGASGDMRDYAFSPDGEHVAYIWNNPLPPHDQKLIVDQNPQPYLAGQAQWSNDSQHLFTRRVVPGTPNITVYDILDNGRAVMRAEGARLIFPPVGNMGIAVITRSRPSQAQFLVVNGKMVPGSEIVNGSIGEVVISPDGKHYAARYTMQNQRQYVFADGKKGLDYQRIDSFQAGGKAGGVVGFTADSSKLFYIGFNDPHQYVVLGDQEIDPKIYSINETVFSPVGDHVALWGQNAKLLLDGKPMGPPPGPPVSTLGEMKYSSDGQHLGYLGGQQLLIDTVPIPGYLATHFLFSPDGKHVAFNCHPVNAPPQELGICMDGGRYVNAGLANNLTFTPDGNHLFWNRTLRQNEVRVFLDGKPVVDGWMITGSSITKEAWSVDANGTLSVLLQIDNTFRRVSVTPSGQTSIATMFSGATGR